MMNSQHAYVLLHAKIAKRAEISTISKFVNFLMTPEGPSPGHEGLEGLYMGQDSLKVLAYPEVNYVCMKAKNTKTHDIPGVTSIVYDPSCSRLQARGGGIKLPFSHGSRTVAVTVGVQN